MDVQTSETRPARFIAVGNRINLKAAASEATFAAELERIVGLAVPNLASDRPNLVALGEVLGLPLALSGKRGTIPRRMHSASVAISMLALSYARRILYYRRVFPRISPVRALLLSLSDTLYRPFTETLSALAARHKIYLSASTITPHVYCSTEPGKIGRFGRREVGRVYLPADPGVYNTGFLWGPDGSLLGTTDKVFLTESERSTLDLTPGDLDEVHPIETEVGAIGIAISLDAFMPEYLQRLDQQGTRIVLQNDANDGVWSGPSATCEWQPQEWLNSVLGCLQDDYPHLMFNICPMQVGNFFDILFDGQSTITMKGEDAPDPQCNFVGNEGFYHTVTGQPFKGKVLALAPWATDDPIRAQPALSLAERRERLALAGKQLLPGGSRANQYPEAAIWADVKVPL
jgi:catechol 2,3-dioxygenase-like lactoylglutathione lyase family enzyme